MRVTKTQAISKLINAGEPLYANLLVNYRDKNGRNFGWDGFMRSKKIPQRIAHIIW